MKIITIDEYNESKNTDKKIAYFLKQELLKKKINLSEENAIELFHNKRINLTKNYYILEFIEFNYGINYKQALQNTIIDRIYTFSNVEAITIHIIDNIETYGALFSVSTPANAKKIGYAFFPIKGIFDNSLLDLKLYYTQDKAIDILNSYQVLESA